MGSANLLSLHRVCRRCCKCWSVLSWKRPRRGFFRPSVWAPDPPKKWKFGSYFDDYLSVDLLALCMSLGEGNGTPLQYCCPENPMDGGAWWAAVHGVTKSQTRLSDFTFTFYFNALEKEMATHSSVLAWRIPGTGSLVGCRLWGRTESDTTEWLGSSCHSSKHTGLVFCYYWDCFVYSTLNS